MSQLIVPRALRKLPPFEIFKNEGVTQQVQMCCRNDHDIKSESNLMISPYSEMIPASYLLEGYNAHTRTNRDLITRVRAENRNGPEARKRLNQYIFHSRMKRVTIGYERRSYSENAEYTFRDGAGHDRFVHGNTYYTVNQYSLYVSRGETLVPCAILAIPRENYIYCRMKLIKTGLLDLSKCVFLIDQALDTTAYPEQSFRLDVYKHIILPQIAQLNVTIAKVPLQYILQKCFMEGITFTSTNIFDRKKEEEELKKALVSVADKYLGGGGSREPSTIPLAEDLIFGGSVTTTTSDSTNINYIDSETYTWTIQAGQSSANSTSGEIRREPYREEEEQSAMHSYIDEGGRERDERNDIEPF